MRLPILSLRRKIALTAGVGALLVVGAVATFAATDPAATLHAQEISLLQQQAALYTQQAQLSTNLAAVEQQLLALDNGGTTTAANALPGVGATDGTAIIPVSDSSNAAPGSAGTNYLIANSAPTSTTNATTSTAAANNPGAATAVAAAMTTLDPSTQAYWVSKLGNAGPGAVVDTYDPATLLARWEQRAAAGTAGTSFTSQDIQIGLAYAQTRAAAAGVTSADVTAAQANIAKYGDIAGTGDLSEAIANMQFNGTTNKLQGDQLTTAATVNPFTTAQINDLNALSAPGIDVVKTLVAKGYTAADLSTIMASGLSVENLPAKGASATTSAAPSANSAVVAASAISTPVTSPAAVTTTDTTAARIATLQAAIATDAAKATTQFAAGNKITAAALQDKVTLYTSELAALQQ